MTKASLTILAFHNIKIADVVALRDEARQAGDAETATDCDTVLTKRTGTSAAARRIAEVIVSARGEAA